MSSRKPMEFTKGDIYAPGEGLDPGDSLWTAGINAKYPEKETPHYNAIEVYAASEFEVVGFREFVFNKLINGVLT